MKKSELHEELIQLLQKVTGTEYRSLISFYFELGKLKISDEISALIKMMAFDEEASRENISASTATYKKLIAYFKNYNATK